MKEQLINFETAKLAKNKGFKESCLYYFSLNGEELKFCEDGLFYYSNGAYGRLILRPTQSLLQKWLREKHNIHIEIGLENYSDSHIWQYQILTINEDYSDNIFDGEFETYEIALEVGLQESLKLI